MAKAAEDAEAQRAKHAESKRQRDVLAADLEHMRVEHAMLRDELKAATPAGAAAKEHEMQVRGLHCLLAQEGAGTWLCVGNGSVAPLILEGAWQAGGDC